MPNGVSFAGGTDPPAPEPARTPSIIDPESGSTYTDEFVGGFEFEAGRSLSLGVRYIHRTMPQILEDIGQLPVVGYFAGAVR